MVASISVSRLNKQCTVNKPVRTVAPPGLKFTCVELRIQAILTDSEEGLNSFVLQVRVLVAFYGSQQIAARYVGPIFDSFREICAMSLLNVTCC